MTWDAASGLYVTNIEGHFVAMHKMSTKGTYSGEGAEQSPPPNLFWL